MLETATPRAPEQQLSARERRRRQTTAEILDAAWALCREEGLAGLSMRGLADRVGMRAPSLYSYVDSKAAIYDAMFRQGYEDLLARTEAIDEGGPVTRERFLAQTRVWFRFCTEDPVRYQLLFQRTIPDFEPSADSYALAVEVLDRAGEALRELGVTDPAALDLWTALSTGLTSQQIANDPGGDRWSRLLDEAAAMFFDHHHVPPDPEETS